VHKSFFLALIWVVLVTVLSLINGSSFSGVGPTIPNADKLVHFLFYFVMQILLCFALCKSYNLIKYLYILLFTLSYGIIIELLQEKITTTRSGDFYDFLANALGAITAFLLLFLTKSKKFYNSKEKQ